MTGTIVAGALSGWIAVAMQPDNASKAQSYWYPTIGAASGAIAGVVGVFLLILIWNLWRAPYRQRDEAKAMLASAQVGNSIASPLPVSDVVTMYLNDFYMYGIRYGTATHYEWGEAFFRNPNQGAFSIVQLTVFLAISPKRTVEDFRLGVLGETLSPLDGWAVENIGQEVARTMDIRLPADLRPGDHPVKLLALIGGKWRSADAHIRFPAPVI